MSHFAPLNSNMSYDDLITRVNELQELVQAQSKGAFAELSIVKKQNQISSILKFAPKIYFNNKNQYAYAKHYDYFKSMLIEDDIRYKDLFDFFEKGDKVGFNALDHKLITYFQELLYKSIYEVQGVPKLLSSLGFLNTPPLYDLMEKIREYHCGPRKIPFNVTKSFNEIKYGISCDNAEAVETHDRVVKVMLLFHREEDSLSSERKAKMLLDNMSDAFKSKLKAHLLSQRLITDGTDDPFASYDDLDKLLKDLKLINSSAIPYKQRCEDLYKINLDKSIRLVNVDVNTIKVEHTNSNSNLGGNGGTSQGSSKSGKKKRRGKNKGQGKGPDLTNNSVKINVGSTDLSVNSSIDVSQNFARQY